VRQYKKRALRNKSAKSALHTYTRKVRQSVEEKKLDEARKALPLAIKVINKTAQKGIIHWKKGARLQSRLVKKVNALAQAAKPENIVKSES